MPCCWDHFNLASYSLHELDTSNAELQDCRKITVWVPCLNVDARSRVAPPPPGPTCLSIKTSNVLALCSNHSVLGCWTLFPSLVPEWPSFPWSLRPGIARYSEEELEPAKKTGSDLWSQFTLGIGTDAPVSSCPNSVVSVVSIIEAGFVDRKPPAPLFSLAAYPGKTSTRKVTTQGVQPPTFSYIFDLSYHWTPWPRHPFNALSQTRCLALIFSLTACPGKTSTPSPKGDHFSHSMLCPKYRVLPESKRMTKYWIYSCPKLWNREKWHGSVKKRGSMRPQHTFTGAVSLCHQTHA